SGAGSCMPALLRLITMPILSAYPFATLRPLPLRRCKEKSMTFLSFLSNGSRLLGASALLLVPILAGCAPGQGKVAGRVLLGGTPVPGGSVLFRPADPKLNSVSAELDEQGNYQAFLPTGEVQVSVD